MSLNRCRSRWAVAIAALILVKPLVGCAHGILRPSLQAPSEVPKRTGKAPQLKVHLRSGELCTLDSWSLSPDGSTLEGIGTLYTISRETKKSTGPQSIPLDSIALLETNTSEAIYPGGLAGLEIMTTVFGTLSAICLSDPKGCFGSCPTFYVEGGSRDRPDAEGFSASIARALEARDVDALFSARVKGSRFAVIMRNEALETHAVKRLRLLSVPRPKGGRVLAGVDGRFYPALEILAPAECRAAEGDCSGPVAAPDDRERVSASDPEDLARRETIELSFPSIRGLSGIVVAARQTQLTTFLFYQTMAYLGSSAGEYLAALERGGPALASRAMAMARSLGGIDVEVAEGTGPWKAIGTYDEAGPIAGDVQVLPFESTGAGPVRVRLRLTKGLWRLGWVARAQLQPPVDPVAHEPESVERGNEPDSRALAALRTGTRHLVTGPGDEYRIVFRLAEPAADLELFLESEGYYYEWMRGEWLAEEDPQMAALALMQPEEALRRLAPEFKRREPNLERAFWSSRFRK